MTEFDEYLGFARELAREAEQEILPVFQRDFEVELKQDRSPVTEADRAAERRIRGLIEKRYPDHGVLGEEYGLTGDEGSSHRWVIDPIDGTVSFTCRVPLFGTLIALLVDGEPTVGVANFPALGKCAWAARGGGAFFDGKAVRVRDCAKLSDALVCATGTHFTELSSGDEPVRVRLGSLLPKVGQFRGWGDCYGHILVASGRADAMIDTAMNPWDNAALVPILREAGASVFGVTGERDDLVNVDSLVSCSPGLTDELLSALRE